MDWIFCLSNVEMDIAITNDPTKEKNTTTRSLCFATSDAQSVNHTRDSVW